MNEFGLIDRYFRKAAGSNRALLGIGDDCGLFSIPPGCHAAVTTDTLVSGVHFFPGTDPHDLGWKCLAVNLSDLAASGASPLFHTLALTLPEADHGFLEPFSQGMDELAQKAGSELIGGDTTRGPMTITITAVGCVPAGEDIRRSGARAGDQIWVTGDLGGAALAVADLSRGRETAPEFLRRLNHPEPRSLFGIRLRGTATSMLDISDGLLADLGHIMEASGRGALLHLEQIPLCPRAVPAAAAAPAPGDLPGLAPDLDLIPEETALRAALTGGDDYELCFTAPPEKEMIVREISQELGIPASCIGSITADPGIRALLRGTPYPLPREGGYTHF